MRNNLIIFINNLLLLTPASRFGFRTAAALTFAVFLAFLLHFPKPFWAAISVIVVMQPYLGNTLDKAIMRIFGTIIGASLGLVIASMVTNHLVLFLSCSFILVSFGYYYAMQSRYPYAFILGSISAFLVMGEIIVNPNLPFFVAIWRTAEVIIGVISTVIMSFLIFPSNAEEDIKKILAKVIKNQNKVFNLCIDIIIQRNKSQKTKVQNIALENKTKLLQCLELTKSLEREYNIDFKLIKHYQFAAEQLLKINRILRDLLVETVKSVDFSVFKKELPEFANLKDNLNLVYQHITQKLISPSVNISPIDLSFFIKLEEQFTTLRKQGILRNYPIEESLASITAFENLSRVIFRLKILDELNIDYQQQQKAYYKFLTWNTFEFKNAITSGLGAVIALLIWMMSNMPNGIQGIISSLVVSMQKNLGDKKQIAANRLLGCFIGGGVGLICVAFVDFSLSDMLITLFLFSWLFGIITNSGKRYAYAGLQANIAMAITFIQPSGITEISPAIERFIGMIIGIVAIFIASYLIIPIKPEQLFEANLKKMGQLLLNLIKSNFLKKSYDENLTDFNTLINYSHNNLSLLNTLTFHKSAREKFYFEVGSEPFERIASILLQIHKNISYDKILAEAKIYDLNIIEDIKQFITQMRWLNDPLVIKFDKKDMGNINEYYQKQLLKIREINLKNNYNTIQSKELIFLYHSMQNIFAISLRFHDNFFIGKPNIE